MNENSTNAAEQYELGLKYEASYSNEGKKKEDWEKAVHVVGRIAQAGNCVGG